MSGRRPVSLLLVLAAAGCSRAPDAGRFRAAVAKVESGSEAGVVAHRIGGVTDGDLAFLPGVANLRHLILDGSRVTDAGMVHVGRLAELETLSLSDTQVTDKGLAHIAGLARLRYLRLDRLPITDAGTEHLARLRSLRYLSLWKARVTDRGLGPLTGLRHLVLLSLDDTEVTGRGVVELCAGLPDLRYLSVANTTVGEAEAGRIQAANAAVRVNR